MSGGDIKPVKVVWKTEGVEQLFELRYNEKYTNKLNKDKGNKHSINRTWTELAEELNGQLKTNYTSKQIITKLKNMKKTWNDYTGGMRRTGNDDVKEPSYLELMERYWGCKDGTSNITLLDSAPISNEELDLITIESDVDDFTSKRIQTFDDEDTEQYSTPTNPKKKVKMSKSHPIRDLGLSIEHGLSDMKEGFMLIANSLNQSTPKSNVELVDLILETKKERKKENSDIVALISEMKNDLSKKSDATIDVLTRILLTLQNKNQ
ncbi:hypothetical protein HK103_003383 [Boothiomyces macroporosus]|uniref:Myb/SANT-like DNA-binding domain-containing protein n=1 Tax=Boothiomyces macroporosus TaxID=261099 RepID=A0AAD5U8R7_9FUNG|nr:hypothetical protein HK103_003383 [Boothiomyces macroporosus]